MIIGAHAILYSKVPDADRAFLRDVLELPSDDVGGGWGGSERASAPSGGPGSNMNAV